MKEGAPVVLTFKQPLKILHRNGWVYNGTRMLTGGDIKEPAENNALWIYFVDERSVRIFEKLRPIPRTNIEDICILEDRQLGIIYLRDDALLPQIIELLRKGKPLHELKPPL